ncbi:hypothetical protein GOODEAATRI_021041, partial [Goodea atripinnis]
HKCHRSCTGRCWGPKEDHCQSYERFLVRMIRNTLVTKKVKAIHKLEDAGSSLSP